MRKCSELQKLRRRNQVDGIIIISTFLVFEIALALTVALMSGEMGAMLSTLKALVIAG